MAENPGAPLIHPNAIVVGIMGAVLAVWIAGRNGSVIGGEIFLTIAILAAFAVNQVKKRELHTT